MSVQIINDNSCIRIINGTTPLLVHKKQVKTIDTIKNDTVRIDIGEGTLRHIYIKLSDVTTPSGLADVNVLRDAIKAMLDGEETDNSSLVSNMADVKTSVDVVKTSVDSVGQKVADAGTAQTNSLNTVKTSVDALGIQISAVKDSVNGLQQSIANISPLAGLQSIHDQIASSSTSQTTQLANMATALTDIKSLLNGTSDNFKDPVRVDESVPMVVYNGYVLSASHYGAATQDPVWAIQRITRNGDAFIYEWAGGAKNFTNVWDNRYNLTYAPVGQ
jgi:hypothetical protein